jgi:hypothetical protein
MKKNILVGLMTIVFCIAITACGNSENKNTASDPDVVATQNDGDEISESNYVSIIKNVFGFEPITKSDWTFKRVSKYDDGEINLFFNVPDGNALDEKSVYKEYFDKTLEISADNKIYRRSMKDGKVVKGTDWYTSYNELKGKPFDNEWVYEYNGQLMRVTLLLDDKEFMLQLQNY